MSSQATFLAAAFDSDNTAFAAVFQGLDGHRLRIVPVVQSNTNVSPQDFVLDKGVKVSSLSWANLPSLDKSQQAKKRKKAGEVSIESSNAVILGTTQGSVLIYSPASNSIIANLKTGAASAVCSIVQQPSKSRLSVLQHDSTLTEFDLAKNTVVSSATMSVTDPTAMLKNPELLIANTMPHLCKPDGEIDITYTGFATPIKQLIMLGKSHFAALAEEDRQVLVYKLDTPKPVHSLMCPSTNAVHISSAADLSAVAVTTEDGQVHVFTDPTQSQGTHKASQKSKKSKLVPQSAPRFTIEVSVLKSNISLIVNQTKFADNLLEFVWPEQGSVPIIDSVEWRSQDGTVHSEDIKLSKQLSAPSAQEHLVGGVDPASAPIYDEKSARVISGDHVADLDEFDTGANNDDDDGETLADRLDALEVEMDKRGNNNHDGLHQRDGDLNADEESDDNDEQEIPSAGGKSSRSLSNAKRDEQSRLRRKELKLKLSQPGSFATLLNQALTLNDKQLLEICLEERDEAMIKLSIIKLQPALAASFLEHLAASMARSQNRSTTLIQWIRWVVVIHGAYLVTLPDLLKTLASLHLTLSSRSSTLPRLLALQGRLELLEEQLSVRNEVAAAAAEDDADEPEAYYDEEEALIVNGEEANEDLMDSPNDEASDDDLEEDIDDEEEDAMLSE